MMQTSITKKLATVHYGENCTVNINNEGQCDIDLTSGDAAGDETCSVTLSVTGATQLYFMLQHQLGKAFTA